MVKERRVRNTVEKTYALTSQSLRLTADDLTSAGPEEAIRLFTRYVGLLLGYFTRYTRRDDVDLARDNILFQSFPLYTEPSGRTRTGAGYRPRCYPI